MDETRAAPAAFRAAAARRRPWLVPGALLLLVLVFLTVNVLTHGPLTVLDERIRDAVQARADSATWRWLGHGRHAPAQLLVDMGKPAVAVPVLALCALIAALRCHSVRPMLTAGLGAAALAVTVIGSKYLIRRPGPGYAVLQHGSLGDFPSGHTTSAGVCYALAVLILAAPGLPGGIRRAAMAAAIALTFLVGLALVWCNYHWSTDVVAGWALAPLIVMAVVRLVPPAVPAGPAAPARPAAPAGKESADGRSGT